MKFKVSNIILHPDLADILSNACKKARKDDFNLVGIQLFNSQLVPKDHAIFLDHEGNVLGVYKVMEEDTDELIQPSDNDIKTEAEHRGS